MSERTYSTSKEILDALVSQDGAILVNSEDDFRPRRYLAVSVPESDVYKDLPTVCGISAANELRAVLIADIDERLHKLMGIPWPHEIRAYPEIPFQIGDKVSLRMIDFYHDDPSGFNENDCAVGTIRIALILPSMDDSRDHWYYSIEWDENNLSFREIEVNLASYPESDAIFCHKYLRKES